MNYIVENTPPRYRYWVDDRVLVGSKIEDRADWLHLKNDYGVGAVINLQIEPNMDAQAGIDVPYINPGIPDDGHPKPLEFWTTCVAFGYAVLREPGRVLYIHCAAGASRSPAVAYAIMRAVLRLSQTEALERVRRRPQPSLWGTHPVQASYVASCEAALSILRELFA